MFPVSQVYSSLVKAEWFLEMMVPFCAKMRRLALVEDLLKVLFGSTTMVCVPCISISVRNTDTG